MTDRERIVSILLETERDYISYDNLHNDNEHGIRVIEKVLKHWLLSPPNDSQIQKEVIK